MEAMLAIAKVAGLEQQWGHSSATSMDAQRAGQWAPGWAKLKATAWDNHWGWLKESNWAEQLGRQRENARAEKRVRRTGNVREGWTEGGRGHESVVKTASSSVPLKGLQ